MELIDALTLKSEKLKLLDYKFKNMKKLILICISCIFTFNCTIAQNIVKCQKQEKLETEKTKLEKQFGADYVNQALQGEITEGMPEALFIKAFNTKEIKYDAEGCKAFEVYDDNILYPRSPGMKKPSPFYLVITSNNKIVKIKPGEGNDSNYKKAGKGIIVY